MSTSSHDTTSSREGGLAPPNLQLGGRQLFVLPGTIDLRDHPPGSAVPDAPDAVPPPETRRRPRIPLSAVPVAIDVAIMAVLAPAVVLAGGARPAGLVFALGFALLVVARREQRRPLTLSVVDTAGALLTAAALAYAVASAFSALTGAAGGADLLFVAALLTGLFLAARSVAYVAARRVRRGSGRVRAVVLGNGIVARHLVAMLDQYSEHGIDVVGIVDPTDGDRLDDALSHDGHLTATLQSHAVDVVLVAFGGGGYGSDARLADVVRDLLALDLDVWMVPRLFDHDQVAPATEHIRGLPVRPLRRPPHRRPAWLVKRTVDVAVAALALVLLLPVLALIGIVVAVDLGRPVLFRQERVTVDGRRFLILKFRTMRPANGPAGEEWAPDEQRMGRFGALLRRTSLDELPQLVNVLRGDMSLVGPRPERPPYVELFGDRYRRYDQRHRVPAGLTGWAQVHGLRGETSIEERALLDNHYIDNWSLGLDLRILARTVGSLLRGR